MARKLLQSNEDQINLLAINAGGSTIPYTGEPPVYVEGQTIGIYPSATSKWNEVDNKLSRTIWDSTTGSFASTAQIDDINDTIGGINTNISNLTTQVSTNTQTIADHTSNINSLNTEVDNIQNSLSAIDELKYDIDDVSGKLDNKLDSSVATLTYLTQSSADTLYYPLLNNPNGYLTEIVGDFSGNNVSATSISLGSANYVIMDENGITAKKEQSASISIDWYDLISYVTAHMS